MRAGLMAEGQTEIHDLYHIDRGYERYVEKWRGLGAKIDRIMRNTTFVGKETTVS